MKRTCRNAVSGPRTSETRAAAPTVSGVRSGQPYPARHVGATRMPPVCNALLARLGRCWGRFGSWHRTGLSRQMRPVVLPDLHLSHLYLIVWCGLLRQQRPLLRLRRLLPTRRQKRGKGSLLGDVGCVAGAPGRPIDGCLRVLRLVLGASSSASVCCRFTRNGKDANKARGFMTFGCACQCADLQTFAGLVARGFGVPQLVLVVLRCSEFRPRFKWEEMW
jgi:hypothetical protein